MRINDAGLKISANKPVHKIADFFLVIGNNKIKKLQEDRLT